MGTGGLQVFVFTDVVGSTRLWAEEADAMSVDLAAHDSICREAAVDYDGQEFANAGDSFGWYFADAQDAVACAIRIQQRLSDASWSVSGGIGVRIGVHVGVAQHRAGNVFGPVLNETARIMSTGHGGQIVVSDAVAALLDGTVELSDLGEIRLRDLDGTWRLHQVAVPGSDNDHPPLRGHRSGVSTLPVRRTALLGRDELVSTLLRAMAVDRLVTLVGPGGAGKTHAATETAGRASGQYDDGVYFVDLTRAPTDDVVASVLIDGLDGLVAARSDATPTYVAESLTTSNSLLVVDNCEHVIDGAATIVDEILALAPRVSVLATSREALEVEGEHLHTIPPLESGSPSSTGVRLFVERALAVDPSFDPDGNAIDAISAIVERLDGMPLAIELAAARVRAMSPVQILEHLDDRFQLLAGKRRGRSGRQQSLEATIDWSYRLLDDVEKKTLRRLSVAAGSLSLQSTARALGVGETEAAMRIESLVAKSLLVPVSMANLSGHRMLETIREFSLERLVESGDEMDARVSLEHALDVSGSDAEDLRAFQTLAAWSPQVTLEAETRLDAASQAFAEGRLRPAAALFMTATAPTQPGSMERVRPQIAELVRVSTGTDAQRWAELALIYNHVWTGRNGTAARECDRIIGELERDDQFRFAAETWSAYVACCVRPVDEAAAFLEDALERAEPTALPENDFACGSLRMAQGLVQVRRGHLDDALPLFDAGIDWSDASSPHMVMNLASLLYVHRRLGAAVPDRHTDLIDRIAASDLHMQNLVAIWRAASADRPVRDRALLIRDIAERHRLGRLTNEHGMFLVALADLEVEVGDNERAEQLLSGVVPPDSLSTIVHSDLLREIHGLARDEWEEWHVATSAGLLANGESPAVRAARAPSLLAEEFDHWSSMSAG